MQNNIPKSPRSLTASDREIRLLRGGGKWNYYEVPECRKKLSFDTTSDSTLSNVQPDTSSNTSTIATTNELPSFSTPVIDPSWLDGASDDKTEEDTQNKTATEKGGSEDGKSNQEGDNDERGGGGIPEEAEVDVEEPTEEGGSENGESSQEADNDERGGGGTSDETEVDVEEPTEGGLFVDGESSQEGDIDERGGGGTSDEAEVDVEGGGSVDVGGSCVVDSDEEEEAKGDGEGDGETEDLDEEDKIHELTGRYEMRSRTNEYFGTTDEDREKMKALVEEICREMGIDVKFGAAAHGIIQIASSEYITETFRSAMQLVKCRKDDVIRRGDMTVAAELGRKRKRGAGLEGASKQKKQ